MDITLQTGEISEQALYKTDNSFLYVIKGSLEIDNDSRPLAANHLGILDQGDLLTINAASI